MTEFSPPPAPSSNVASFGTSIVGPSFEWHYVDEDGQEHTIKARAVSSVTFDETLRYTTGRHAQIVQTANSAKSMREDLGQIQPTDDGYMEKFNDLVQRRLDFEGAAWAAAIETMLLLVNPPDRDKLREPLLKGDPKQVTQLRGWLEQQVLATAQTDAATVAHVDPTSAGSSENSSPNPASGDDSEPKESTSTD